MGLELVYKKMCENALHIKLAKNTKEKAFIHIHVMEIVNLFRKYT